MIPIEVKDGPAFAVDGSSEKFTVAVTRGDPGLAIFARQAEDKIATAMQRHYSPTMGSPLRFAADVAARYLGGVVGDAEGEPQSPPPNAVY